MSEQLETSFMALENSYKELEDRTISLQEKTELAEVANRSKSNFLANMSHELRTPLSMPLWVTERLLQEDAKDLGLNDFVQDS